jgi:hypothetical protein
MPLFVSEEVRDIILKEVAAHTDCFTPRYLGNIATIAKSHLVDRVAKDKGRIVGLTEQDLEGYRFEVEDWEKALDEVSQKYDSRSVREYDERLQKFVKKHSTGAKFFSVETDKKRFFSPEIVSRVLAAEAHLEQNDSPQL